MSRSIAGQLSLLLLSLSAVVLMAAPRAWAIDYFRVSPGPLNEGHAKYDHSDGCANCHIPGTGVTKARCLSCHTNVLHKQGLHRTFGNRSCIDCHTEHKGRKYNIIDWSSVGGRDAFQHDKVGFPLQNYHGQVACAKCHVARLITGRTSYLGLSPSCQSCHAQMHQFNRTEFSQKCDLCHDPGKSLRGARLSSWANPHARYSGIEFVGKHLDQVCTKCHAGGAMPGRSPARSCVSCHTPNHPVTSRTAICVDCHSQTSEFRRAKIDHSDYGFVLTGKHATTGCRSCHAPGSKTRGRVRACGECHQADHPVVRATANCARCHVSGKSFRGARIDHARFGFALLGRHRPLRCKKCHTRPNRRLSYEEGNCVGCHTHRNAHRGQFADKACASCHVEGGKRTSPFDHNKDTRFPLIGFHAQAKVRDNCESCHPKLVYRTGKIHCVDCHKDKHKGSLGSNCERCHTPLTAFDAPRGKMIDHRSFPLEGRHKIIACVACHANDQYHLGHKECVDCHLKDDVHGGRLGRDCGKCHRPEKGAPKFSHAKMTRFARTGAHRRVPCAVCHQPRAAAAPRTVGQWRKISAPKLDRRFPVFGKRCSDCHADPHRGGYGTDCERCHQTGRFSSLSRARAVTLRPRDHGAGWLRYHTTLAETGGSSVENTCASCHGRPACRNCHRTSAPRSHTGLFRIKTHGRYASFDPNSCRTCHQTASCTQCHRRTAPLNHRGAWTTLHGYAAGGFGDSNCNVCHRRADCAVCHGSR